MISKRLNSIVSGILLLIGLFLITTVCVYAQNAEENFKKGKDYLD